MAVGQGLRVSERGRLAPPSPVRKLTPLANAARSRGIHIYHVNIGQPDIATPAAILESIRSYNAEVVPYAPSPGISETIEAWSAYYDAVGLRVGPSELIVTVGGSEALWFAFMAAADHGDEMLMFEPTYANYLGFSTATDIVPVPVTLSGEHGFHLPPADVIEARITPRTRAMVIANPNNPTGTVYGRDELAVLVDIALRHDLFLISDETYREIVFDGARHTSVLELADEDPSIGEHVVVVDSVSKRFSATGVRVGCVVSCNREFMSAVGRFAQARLSGPTVEQLAVVPLLRNPTAYTDALRQEYQRRRDVVFGALQRIPGVRCTSPSGAFYIMVGLPIDDADTFAAWLLTDFHHGGETVMMAPGAGFYITPGLGRDEVRIAYVLEGPNLVRAIEILDHALRAYPGRRA